MINDSIVILQYEAFVTSFKEANLIGLPEPIKQQIQENRFCALDSGLTVPTSILRNYLVDLLFLTFPGFHTNSTGDTYRNISFYTDLETSEAFCCYSDGACRTTVSMALVRQLAGLANATFPLIDPAIDPKADVSVTQTRRTRLADLLTARATVTEEEFDAIISKYPRLPSWQHSPDETFTLEYLLFADMLRFIWCHEWGHGIAGHAKIVSEKLGLMGLYENDGGLPYEDADLALTLHSLEFDADSRAVAYMMDQILRGLDMPGRALHVGTLEQRLGWMSFSVGLVISHMAILERHLDPGLRLHPPARLRHIYASETLTYWLTKAGFVQSVSDSRLFAWRHVYKLAGHINFFGDWLSATTGVGRPPDVKIARVQMTKYRERLENLDLPNNGYRINYDVSDTETAIRGALMLTPFDIQNAEKLSEEDLLAKIGTSVELRSGMSAFSSRDRLVEKGRKWFDDYWLNSKESLCRNGLVCSRLRSERAMLSETIEIVALAIIDAALLPPVPLATLAALIARRGITNLCSEIWSSL